MTPFGTYPTPWGVNVVVYKTLGSDELHFDPNAVATCAGVHDPEARERFIRDAKSAGAFPDRLDVYGGRRTPHIPLPRPITPITPNIDMRVCEALPLDAWINGVMDQSRWCDRASVLVHAIETNLAGNDDDAFEPILLLGLRVVMSAALEHLCEREIACLEAAAFYALSALAEWQSPALQWLEPVAKTWWADWIKARPAIARLASHCDDLPSWFRSAGT